MDAAEIRRKMAETNQRFERDVVGAGNVDALDSIYTAGARILPPGAEMIAGRENIKGFWKGMLADAHLKKAALVTVEADIRDDVVTEIGRCDLVIQPAGQPESAMTVKYVVVWKEEDGVWKWHWDIWNAAT